MVKVEFKNGKPIVLPPYSKQGVYLDGKLKKVLDRLNYRKTKNLDNVVIIVGEVGSGKTSLAFSAVNYMSGGKLTLDNIGVGASGGLKKLVDAKYYEDLMLDDASPLLMSSEHSSKVQKNAIKIMHLCRSKKLSIFITAPDLFRINPYVINDRATCVIKVYMDSALNRGRFAFYGRKKIKGLYAQGKKNKGVWPHYPRPDFLGRFTDYVPDFNDDYEKEKQKAMRELTEEKKPTEHNMTLKELKPIYLNLLKKIPEMQKPISQTQFADLIGVRKSTISDWKALLRTPAP